MSDKYVPVILISRDRKLIQAVSSGRPPGCEFTLIDPQAKSLPRPTTPVRCWIDLDGLTEAGISLDHNDLPRASVLFTSHTLNHPPPHGTLVVQKPWTSRMLLNLWEPQRELPTPAIAESPATGMLPAWILEFHEQHLAELCRSIVERLPQHLGYRETSLYLYDADHNVLNLAECNHDAPLAFSLSIRHDDSAPMITAVREKYAIQANRVADWLKEHGIQRDPGHRDYAEDGCLILPLISNDQLQGVINLNARQSNAPDISGWREAMTTFLARSLRFAREYDATRTEARVDELTSLFNYRCALETIESEIRRAARFDSDLSVVMIDLDGLKCVNDSLGHAAGNVLIRHVANKIRMALRRFDTAARVGGDEFIVILPATDAVGAKRVVKRILESIRDDAATYQNETLPISASLGIAQWQLNWNSAQLLEAADQAMYAAKRSGRLPQSELGITSIHEMVAAKIDHLAPGGGSPIPLPSPVPKP